MSLSKNILGSLMIQTPFLDLTSELDETLFQDLEKRTFKFVAKEWEDHRRPEIDPRILEKHLGGDGSGVFVSSIMDGIYKLSPEIFVGRVIELKREVINRRLAGRLKKDLAIELKTGILDLSPEIFQDIDELRRLQQPKHVNVFSLEKIEPKRISWLWPGRIPRAMLTLLCGDPGVGKSFCSIAVAARLSRGLPLPGEEKPGTACGSLFICGEDPLAEAVRPRVDANGGDPSRILVLQEPEFHLTDIEKLRVAVGKQDIGLVILDPLSAFLPAKTKWLEDPSIRAALLPLADFAEETGIAILAIAHFRKSEADEIVHKVAGSIGLAGIARSILAVTWDKDDRERRLLLPIKASYSRKPDGLAFRITDDLQVVFENAPVKATVEDILSSRETREAADETKFNVKWLMDFLRDGPKTIAEIERESPGISRRTLFRIADKLEQSRKLERVPGTTGKFKVWRLPA